jgi:hypothetical protein
MSFTRFHNRVQTKPLGLHNNRGCVRGLGSTGPRAFSALAEPASPDSVAQTEHSLVLPYVM